MENWDTFLVEYKYSTILQPVFTCNLKIRSIYQEMSSNVSEWIKHKCHMVVASCRHYDDEHTFVLSIDTQRICSQTGMSKL